MGCCGCDNKTSTTWGTIIAIIQSLISFIMSCYSCSIFFSGLNQSQDRAYLWWITYSSNGSLKALCVINALLQAFWCISSIVGLIGNQKDNAIAIRQWFVSTIIVIICDVILPSILLAVTASAVLDAINSNTFNSNIYITGMSRNYLLVVWAFSRGGLITWIANICFCSFAARRIQEILHPQTGYVIAQPIVMAMPAGQGMYPQSPPPNLMYAQPQQQAMYGQQPAYGQQPMYGQQQPMYGQQPNQSYPQQQPPPPGYTDQMSDQKN